MNDQILQILIQNGYIDEAGAQDIADLAKTESKSVRRQVLDSGVLDEDSLLAAMAAYQDTEAIDLGAMTIDTEVTEAIPASTARMYNVFPVAADDSSVTLATFDIVDPRISDEMLFTLSKEVKFVFAREKDVMDRISQYYGDSNGRTPRTRPRSSASSTSSSTRESSTTRPTSTSSRSRTTSRSATAWTARSTR